MSFSVTFCIARGWQFHREGREEYFLQTQQVYRLATTHGIDRLDLDRKVRPYETDDGREMLQINFYVAAC